MAVTHGAVGKVATGFSKPYVALYNNTGGTITYTSGQLLARGVEVSIEPESSDMNRFYADNLEAEASGGYMTGGTLNLTVDGLLMDAQRLIMGLPAAGTDGWVEFGDNQTQPYVTVGFIVRYMSGGVESFTPTIISKCVFDQITKSAATQAEDIDWQTQELVAQILRADDPNHNWKEEGEDFATEAEAEAALL